MTLFPVVSRLVAVFCQCYFISQLQLVLLGVLLMHLVCTSSMQIVFILSGTQNFISSWGGVSRILPFVSYHDNKEKEIAKACLLQFKDGYFLAHVS
jgi:hypothetical protein